MLFSELEKKIYTAPSGEKYDPVALCHQLVLATGGLLDEWLDLWWGEETSDQDRAVVALQLAAAARQAFGFKKFDEEGGKLDGEVLEALYHFEQYLSKKG